MMMLRLLLLALLLAACGGAAPSPTAHLVTGSLRLGGPGHISLTGMDYIPGTDCTGMGGFEDIAAGGQVLVVNEAGTTIATARLATGAMARRTTWGCWFDFAVPNVPDAAFYSVKVNQRAGPTWSRAQMEANGWKVELTLGE